MRVCRSVGKWEVSTVVDGESARAARSGDSSMDGSLLAFDGVFSPRDGAGSASLALAGLSSAAVIPIAASRLARRLAELAILHLVSVSAARQRRNGAFDLSRQQLLQIAVAVRVDKDGALGSAVLGMERVPAPVSARLNLDLAPVPVFGHF